MSTHDIGRERGALGVHRRLETHVVVAVTLVVGLALVAALFIARRVVTDGSRERTSTELAAARSAFYRLQDDRAEFAAAQATLVTALPVFRAHVTDSRLAGDLATMEVLADEYRRQLKAAFCIVTGREGSWAGRSGWPVGISPPASIRSMISAAAAGQPRRDIADVDGRLFLIVSEPARSAEETLGTLTVGFALDDGVARQLAQVTHSEVNIVVGGRLLASSLSGDERARLATVIATDQSIPMDATRMERLGGTEYVAAAFPLAPNQGLDTTGRLILLQDWAPTRRYLTRLGGQLLAASAAIFAFALAGGLLLARRVSRPLKEMASAAGDIAAGNWNRQVPVRGSAEAIALAEAFNAMTASLRHWYEEAKRRDDELRQAQKMEAIGRLAGGIAHDFNNLLTTMRGYGELAMIRLKEPGPAMEELAEIVAAVDRAAELTMQLLTFSRRQAVSLRALALDQVVTSAEHMLRRVVGEDVELVVSIEPNLGLVRADRGQMEQVLLNLVLNARDAMPEGGVLRIGIAHVKAGAAPHDVQHAAVPQEYVCLSVADTGSGMDDQTASRVFEPFFTTKDAGRGTGLGLALVYGIVEHAGGMIDVDTKIGRGTTFRVYLPQTTESEKAQQAAAPPGRQTEPSAHGIETVLVAEDDRPLRTLICNTLRTAGYTVIEGADGEEALSAARSVPVDLLITDVVMRGMDGRVLSTHVTSKHTEARILFMSGYPDETIARHGVETTGAGFIRKPFSMDALTAKVRDMLENPLNLQM